MHRLIVVAVAAAALTALTAAGVPAGSPQAHQPPVVDVVSTGHAFDMPAEVPAGWVTFRYHNQTSGTHFAVIERMPEGRTVEDSEREVVPVFQDAMDRIAEGDRAAGFAEFANLPAWYFDVVFMGGPGLIGPSDVAETTVSLEPGAYVLECYVKTADGTFHSAMGMIEGFVVTEQESGAAPPRADMSIALSDDGIAVDGQLMPGRRTVAVHFETQRTYGNLLQHDLHLARLDGGDVDALNSWMDWTVGLDNPAPATFLGGTHEMPAGHTAYVTVDIRPGQYAWVSEIDDPLGRGFLQSFSVPSPAGR